MGQYAERGYAGLNNRHLLEREADNTTGVNEEARHQRLVQAGDIELTHHILVGNLDLEMIEKWCSLLDHRMFNVLEL